MTYQHMTRTHHTDPFRLEVDGLSDSHTSEEASRGLAPLQSLIGLFQCMHWMHHQFFGSQNHCRQGHKGPTDRLRQDQQSGAQGAAGSARMTIAKGGLLMAKLVQLAT